MVKNEPVVDQLGTIVAPIAIVSISSKDGKICRMYLLSYVLSLVHGQLLVRLSYLLLETGLLPVDKSISTLDVEPFDSAGYFFSYGKLNYLIKR